MSDDGLCGTNEHAGSHKPLKSWQKRAGRIPACNKMENTMTEENQAVQDEELETVAEEAVEDEASEDEVAETDTDESEEANEE